MKWPFAGSSFLGTFGLAVLAIVGLFAVDMFLARAERAESIVEAVRLFGQGQILLQRGQPAKAIDSIEQAIAIDRGNRDYRRALAEAQLAAGRTADARATLTELLMSDPSDGLPSLIMARMLVKEDRVAEAVSYFHRAIYGHWQERAAEERLRTRFELIDLLARHNSKEDLLAELLPIQEQAPRDLATRTRIGRLFLLAGSPARAADVFRGILHDAPSNSDAYTSLGKADFAQGNYRMAQRHFQTALRLTPGNQAARQYLEVCSELLILDPTMRGLGAAERFRRSIRLIGLVLDETNHCIGPSPSPDVQGLLEKAGKTLKAHVSVSRQAEVSEINLDLAEQLWQIRKKECKVTPPPDTPLRLVLARLAQ